ncbi:multidrug ABC transporter ATPase [Microbacterium betulae]|uniref:Multidrug ABC transporter ATPase n=1 Tax=Microbacterium betulae TaxID=2981139 RepID=A0AA97FJI0_9MICO|nr:multidrug ABC transporter ATPase [Microbacterium sp. AB]WOF23884.1 multidrug ABC transporter ATPase [Microbacterium sp. AB]
MSTPPSEEPSVRRIDRILAFMSLGIVVLSIACFLSVIIATAVGNQDFSGGVWPVVYLVQMIGPVIAFLLLVALLIMSFARKGRSSSRD